MKTGCQASIVLHILSGTCLGRMWLYQPGGVQDPSGCLSKYMNDASVSKNTPETVKDCRGVHAIGNPRHCL